MKTDLDPALFTHEIIGTPEYIGTHRDYDGAYPDGYPLEIHTVHVSCPIAQAGWWDDVMGSVDDFLIFAGDDGALGDCLADTMELVEFINGEGECICGHPLSLEDA